MVTLKELEAEREVKITGAEIEQLYLWHKAQMYRCLLNREEAESARHEQRAAELKKLLDS